MVSLLSRIDTGHEDIIHDAKMDYYGVQLATCSSDHSVKIFSLKNNSAVLTADLRGHYGPVWQVAWAHPEFGNVIASCSYDRKVIIWRQMQEWVKIYEYSNHDASVNSIAFAPKEYGLMLACASADGSISVLSLRKDGSWDSKKMNAHTIGCNAVSWCPGNLSRSLRIYNKGFSKLNTNKGKHFVTGGCDNTIKIWTENEVGRWIEKTTLEGHTDWVRDVAWAPCIGSPQTYIASCSQDRKVIVWSSDDTVNWQPNVIHIFDDVIWNVSWSLTGNVLAVSGADNKVSLWKEGMEHKWVCINESASSSNK